MKIFILLFSLISLIACKRFSENNLIELYSDTSGFKIQADLPVDWVDYKNIPVFLDEELLFCSYKGAKDTSTWIILNVYRFESLNSTQIGIDSILKRQKGLVFTENRTAIVLTKDTQKAKSGKLIGFLDTSVDNGRNGRDFRRRIIFYEAGKMGILEVNTKNDYNAFLTISNRILRSISY